MPLGVDGIDYQERGPSRPRWASSSRGRPAGRRARPNRRQSSASDWLRRVPHSGQLVRLLPLILTFNRDDVALVTKRSDQVEARKSPQFRSLRSPVGRRVASESSHRTRSTRRDNRRIVAVEPFIA